MGKIEKYKSTNLTKGSFFIILKKGYLKAIQESPEWLFK